MYECFLLPLYPSTRDTRPKPNDKRWHRLMAHSGAALTFRRVLCWRWWWRITRTAAAAAGASCYCCCSMCRVACCSVVVVVVQSWGICHTALMRRLLSKQIHVKSPEGHAQVISEREDGRRRIVVSFVTPIKPIFSQNLSVSSRLHWNDAMFHMKTAMPWWYYNLYLFNKHAYLIFTGL